MRRLSRYGVLGRCIGCMAMAALILVAMPCLAQDTAQEALSLQQCIDLALKNQVSVLTGQNNVTISQNGLIRARSSYFPQVALTNNTFHTSSNGSSGGSIGGGSGSNTGTALTASQTIYDSGLREANVQESIYGVRQNVYGLQRTQQSVVFNVTQAYYEALRAKRLAEVQDSNVKYNEELRKQIQAQATAGEAARVDVLPVEAQLANAQVSLLSARNSVRTSVIQLQNAMGLSPRPGFDIKEVTDISEPRMASLDDYTRQALTTRPDVLQSQASTGAARTSARAAGISLYPRFQVSADYQQGLTGNIVNNDASITGSIVFDVFDGGANRATLRQAQYAHANATLQEQQLQKDIEAQVEQAYLNLTNSKERLAASQVGLDASQANYDAQRERYKNGLAIPLDLLNAQVQLITAQSSLVQARYDYYEAIAQMQFASGQQGETNGGK